MLIAWQTTFFCVILCKVHITPYKNALYAQNAVFRRTGPESSDIIAHSILTSWLRFPAQQAVVYPRLLGFSMEPESEHNVPKPHMTTVIDPINVIWQKGWRVALRWEHQHVDQTDRLIHDYLTGPGPYQMKTWVSNTSQSPSQSTQPSVDTFLGPPPKPTHYKLDSDPPLNTIYPRFSEDRRTSWWYCNFVTNWCGPVRSRALSYWRFILPKDRLSV